MYKAILVDGGVVRKTIAVDRKLQNYKMAVMTPLRITLGEGTVGKCLEKSFREIEFTLLCEEDDCLIYTHNTKIAHYFGYGYVPKEEPVGLIPLIYIRKAIRESLNNSIKYIRKCFANKELDNDGFEFALDFITKNVAKNITR